MFEDDERDENLEDTLRSIARELSESVRRKAAELDVDELSESIGVDADRAREWVENAASWLGRRFEDLGEDFKVPKVPNPWRQSGDAPWSKRDPGAGDPWRGSDPAADPLRGAAPHPLDMPTEEQALALAALESGRWTVEPGTETLAAHRDGPGPSDALGLVRELRARDWIAADGTLTAAGRHALERWLEGAARSRTG
jgi:hypothetical protein